VLSTPPAFVLSQDQTLQEEFNQLARTAAPLPITEPQNSGPESKISEIKLSRSALYAVAQTSSPRTFHSLNSIINQRPTISAGVSKDTACRSVRQPPSSRSPARHTSPAVGPDSRREANVALSRPERNQTVTRSTAACAPRRRRPRPHRLPGEAKKVTIQHGSAPADPRMTSHTAASPTDPSASRPAPHSAREHSGTS
jgi:hypothetical protein